MFLQGQTSYRIVKIFIGQLPLLLAYHQNEPALADHLSYIFVQTLGEKVSLYIGVLVRQKGFTRSWSLLHI